MRGLLCLGLVTLSLLAVLAGCGGSKAVRVPDQKPDTTGVITSLEGARMLVKEDRKIASGEPGQVWVTLDAHSQIAVRDKGALRPGTATDLKLDKKVEVWFAGPILESYPAQASARFVVVNN